jgi:hypothetical protein
MGIAQTKGEEMNLLALNNAENDAESYMAKM